MLKSILSNTFTFAKQFISLNQQSIRGIKNRGEYFKRYGYKYTDHFKGGKKNKSLSVCIWLI